MQQWQARECPQQFQEKKEQENFIGCITCAPPLSAWFFYIKGKKPNFYWHRNWKKEKRVGEWRWSAVVVLMCNNLPFPQGKSKYNHCLSCKSEKIHEEKRREDPNILSRRITMAMATDVSISGCTIRRNTSTPKATPPTASFCFISATLLFPSYTAQHRCAYDPSISYIIMFLLLDDEDDPVPLCSQFVRLTWAKLLLFRIFTFFLTENNGLTAVSPSYTSQLSPRLNLW